MRGWREEEERVSECEEKVTQQTNVTDATLPPLDLKREIRVLKNVLLK